MSKMTEITVYKMFWSLTSTIIVGDNCFTITVEDNCRADAVVEGWGPGNSCFLLSDYWGYLDSVVKVDSPDGFGKACHRRLNWTFEHYYCPNLFCRQIKQWM